jgi:hypothetical protein
VYLHTIHWFLSSTNRQSVWEAKCRTVRASSLFLNRKFADSCLVNLILKNQKNDNPYDICETWRRYVTKLTSQPSSLSSSSSSSLDFRLLQRWLWRVPSFGMWGWGISQAINQQKEVVRSSVTSANFYWTTRRHVPKDRKTLPSHDYLHTSFIKGL